MSEYLNQFIRALQVEADDERAVLERIRAKGLREPKDAGSQLRRTLQRLEILKSLRASEAAKSRTRVRAMSKMSGKRRVRAVNWAREPAAGHPRSAHR